MDQPPLNLSAVDQSPPGESKQTNSNKSRKMPSAGEMVAHYEKLGMETHEASLKVIADLQGAVFRAVGAGRRRNSRETTSAKLDAVHNRLVHLEMKLDSKPSYPQAVAVGVASAGIWSGIVQIWNLIRPATSSSPSS